MLASSKKMRYFDKRVLYALVLSTVLSIFTSVTFIAIAVSSNFGIGGQSAQIDKTIKTVKGLVDETKDHSPQPKAALGLSISSLQGIGSIFDKLSSLLLTFGCIIIIGLAFQIYVIIKLI